MSEEVKLPEAVASGVSAAKKKMSTASSGSSRRHSPTSSLLVHQVRSLQICPPSPLSSCLGPRFCAVLDPTGAFSTLPGPRLLDQPRRLSSSWTVPWPCSFQGCAVGGRPLAGQASSTLGLSWPHKQKFTELSEHEPPLHLRRDRPWGLGNSLLIWSTTPKLTTRRPTPGRTRS